MEYHKAIIQQGEIYRYYKGKYYQVLALAHHSKTHEPFVIYQDLYTCPTFGDKPIWALPNQFLQEITFEDEKVLRFSLVKKDLY